MKVLKILSVIFLSLTSLSSYSVQQYATVKLKPVEIDGEFYFDCSGEIREEADVSEPGVVFKKSSVVGRLLIPSLTLLGLANLPMTSAGPLSAAFCPGLCPVVITAGCSPFGQSLIISALTTLTGGGGAVVGPAVVGMCTAGVGATIASCEPVCVVALGAPLWP